MTNYYGGDNEFIALKNNIVVIVKKNVKGYAVIVQQATEETKKILSKNKSLTKLEFELIVDDVVSIMVGIIE